jgi:hypothetical protein
MCSLLDIAIPFVYTDYVSYHECSTFSRHEIPSLHIQLTLLRSSGASGFLVALTYILLKRQCECYRKAGQD